MLVADSPPGSSRAYVPRAGHPIAPLVAVLEGLAHHAARHPLAEDPARPGHTTRARRCLSSRMARMRRLGDMTIGLWRLDPKRRYRRRRGAGALA